MLDLKNFYIEQIQDDFFPYWIKFIDSDYGGILNCISNDGSNKLSDLKFTWSQGRWLWILGRIHDMNKQGVFPKINNIQLEQWMEATYQFITKYSIYGDNVCCFLLERDGQKKVDNNTGCYDASIYADCFALIGMAQYIKTMEKKENLPQVEALYSSIVRRIEDKEYRTEPYPVPPGYEVHGIPMILVNTIQEYVHMRQRLGLSSTDEIQYGMQKVQFILEELYDGKYIREHVSKFPESGERLLDRHINPGHTFEDLWFLTEYLNEFGGLEKLLPHICKIAKNTFEIGWDNEYGGLLRFVDREGGKPHGKQINTPYEQLILDTWDMKLWWPHSEILYLFHLLYQITGDEMIKNMYDQSVDYIFRTFPNQEIGEWIQIRRRDGTPEEKVVALPVKDPFHIMRNFLKIIELDSISK